MTEKTETLHPLVQEIFDKYPWVYAVIDREDGLHVVGPKSTVKEVLTRDAGDQSCVIWRPELTQTQRAVLTLLANPDLSIHSVAKYFGLDVGGISRALKPYVKPCPACGTNQRPQQPPVIDAKSA
ncbi:MAG TPA: hypothetical protein VFV43_01550 [Limnobacter sp.]|nr:hypothetical protein [Limnobacter sp.]